MSCGSPGAPPRTPGHDHRFSAMLFSLIILSDSGKASDPEKSPLISARCASDIAMRLMAHAGQLRLGTGRQPRRRPGRLVPPARPVRPGRTQGRRAGHAALPAAQPARPAGPPRPRPRAEDQPHLALETGIPRLLAAAMRPARTRLTRPPPSPRPGKEADPAQSEPVPPSTSGHPPSAAAT